jgi:hypothetical protein
MASGSRFALSAGMDSTLRIALPCAAALALSTGVAQACPDGLVEEHYVVWKGEPLEAARVAFAGGTFLTTWSQGEATRAFALQRDGSTTSREPLSLPSLSPSSALVSSPDLHLVVTPDATSATLRAQRVDADGREIGPAILVDGHTTTAAPAVVFDGQRFIVAWKDTFDRSLRVAMIDEPTGSLRPPVILDRSTVASGHVMATHVGDVTWVLWEREPPADDKGPLPRGVWGIRIGADGAVRDAAPVDMGTNMALDTTASVGDSALIAGCSDRCELAVLSRSGLSKPVLAKDIPFGNETCLTPVPALDGYVLWTSFRSIEEEAFPARPPTTEGFVLSRDGTVRSSRPFASLPASCDAIAFDGESFLYAAREDVTDAKSSRLVTDRVSLDGAHHDGHEVWRAPMTAIDTIRCVEPSRAGCQIGGSPSSGILVVVAFLLVALPLRRRGRRA